MNINGLHNKKISLFIGLNENKKGFFGHYKKISIKKALRVVSLEFICYGVSGFSFDVIGGSWLNVQEKSLNITFFNTFGVSKTKLNKMIKSIKKQLNQDSILLEVLNVPFEFI